MFELVFRHVGTTRKMANLRANPEHRVRHRQPRRPARSAACSYEGLADEPSGTELARVKELYFAKSRKAARAFPAGDHLRAGAADVAALLGLRWGEPLILDTRRAARRR